MGNSSFILFWDAEHTLPGAKANFILHVEGFSLLSAPFENGWRILRGLFVGKGHWVLQPKFQVGKCYKVSPSGS